MFCSYLLGRGFHFLFPSPTDVKSHNRLLSKPSVFAGTSFGVHPLAGSSSLLTHRLVSGSDTICNSLSLLGRGFHILFPSPTNVGSHSPLSFVAQRPRWHIVRCPPPMGLNVLAGTPSGVWL